MLSRRGLLCLLGGAAGLPGTTGQGQAQVVEDRGIGGTGVTPMDGAPADRGIGGTGVVGTIRRFGSIVVNDMRIAYGPSSLVSIDGRRMPQSALRIGQMVRLVAVPVEGGLHTGHIAVTSEVVGQITEVGRGRLTVLGQTVVTGRARMRGGWRPGQRVMVSGLRRPDGAIVASRVDPAPDGESRLSGWVAGDRDGVPAIGGLRLIGLEHDLIGRRVLVVGRERANRFFAAGVEREDEMLGRLPAETFSVEALLERDGDSVSMGSDLPAIDGFLDFAVPDDGLFRAVLTATRDGAGGLVISAVRVTDRIGGGSRGDRGGGPISAGGPMPPGGAPPSGPTPFNGGPLGAPGSPPSGGPLHGGGNDGFGGQRGPLSGHAGNGASPGGPRTGGPPR